MAFAKLMTICVTVAALSLPAVAQTANKYQSLSRELAAAGKVAMKGEKTDEATALFERALVADPSNVQALVGLGMASEAKGKLGKSLKYYRQALEIEPNDKPALEAQALAFLKRDMVDRATTNRDKLARLCSTGCDALDEVDSALEAYHAQKADAGTSQHAEASKDGE